MNRKILLITFIVLILIFVAQSFYIPSALYNGKQSSKSAPSKSEVWEDVSSEVTKKFDKLQDIETIENRLDDRYEIVITAQNIKTDSIKLNISHSVAYIEAQIFEKTQTTSYSFSFSRSFRIDDIYDTTRPIIENFENGFKIIFHKK